MIEIRPTRPQDHAAIHAIHRQAFDGPNEARLVELLYNRDKALVSLVALLNDEIVGHVLFSAVSFEPAQPQLNAVGLAPVAVLPQHQNLGIGSQLIVEGLEICRTAGYDAVVLLGHPEYYPRFGFARASDYGLGNEYGADDAFMVIELKQGVLKNVKAIVKYQPEFAESGT